MNDLEYKRKILISAIYDIFDNLDLLKMIIDLTDSENKKKYFELIDNLDFELNRIIYNLRYELEEDAKQDSSMINSVEVTKKKLNEDEIIDLAEFIQKNY